ncbi:MAG: hypothetical protein JST92_23350 [Deltaproteobacteria bacterium]|nr:hypothetical protein [Deltaproteobacteria bacterium]
MLALLGGLGGSSCKPQGPPSQRAFYVWRTTLSLSERERASLHALHAGRLYLRVFDVDHDPASMLGPQTIAKVALAEGLALPPGADLVPVVFLRERLFRAMTAARAQTLAAEVLKQTREAIAPLHAQPHELQLDCDWTDMTREAYFAFLNALTPLAREAGMTLSATIRLHQIKFRERTGVPPVARGMLMFYGMGRAGPSDTDRGIFDAGLAAQYLSRLPEYPLPLDVALPIWSWVVQVRDDRPLALLQALDPAQLASMPKLEARGDHRYLVREDTFVDGVFLRAGDALKVESPSSAEVLEAARLLAPHLPPRKSGRAVALFDLSERNLARHDDDSLGKLFDAVP